MVSILAKRIIREHPNGFVGAIVEGKRGVGKSSYCLKVMKEVYQEINGCSEDEAYRIALSYMKFTISDMIELLSNARKKRFMIPVITWDDAGVHGSNLQWFINMHGVQQLKALTDTIRTATTGFLINCPSRHSLLKSLRNYDDYVVDIVKTGSGNKGEYRGYARVARGYNLHKLPSGMMRVYKNFEDHYSCYVPKSIYTEYMGMRDKYMDDAIEQMERMKDKLKRPGVASD